MTDIEYLEAKLDIVMVLVLGIGACLYTGTDEDSSTVLYDLYEDFRVKLAALDERKQRPLTQDEIDGIGV